MSFVAYLLLFLIFSLSFIFVNLITVVIGVFLLWFILCGALCFLDFVDCFLSHVMEVFSYYLFKYFLRLFFFLFFYWDPYNGNVEAFNVVSKFSQTVLISFILFSLFVAVIFTNLSFSTFIHFLVTLLC